METNLSCSFAGLSRYWWVEDQAFSLVWKLEADEAPKLVCLKIVFALKRVFRAGPHVLTAAPPRRAAGGSPRPRTRPLLALPPVLWTRRLLLPPLGRGGARRREGSLAKVAPCLWGLCGAAWLDLAWRGGSACVTSAHLAGHMVPAAGACPPAAGTQASVGELPTRLAQAVLSPSRAGSPWLIAALSDLTAPSALGLGRPESLRAGVGMRVTDLCLCSG